MRGRVFALLGLFALASVAGEKPFDYEALLTLIKDNQIKKIDDLVDKLPADLKANFTLMRSTGSSTQGASGTNPRAILFGRDASLTLTFNGNATQSGYQDLEIMQWRPTERRFEMRRIVFDSEGKADPKPSDANPGACLGCHGRAPRPLFSPYNEWPGAYGEADDELREKEDWKAFSAHASKHPRYAPILKAAPGGINYWQHGRDRLYARMPNTRFTEAISFLTSVRNQRMREGRDHYRAVAFAEQALQNECHKAGSPETVKDWREALLAFLGKFAPDSIPKKADAALEVFVPEGLKKVLVGGLKGVAWTPNPPAGLSKDDASQNYSTGEGQLNLFEIHQRGQYVLKSVEGLARHALVNQSTKIAEIPYYAGYLAESKKMLESRRPLKPQVGKEREFCDTLLAASTTELREALRPKREVAPMPRLAESQPGTHLPTKP